MKPNIAPERVQELIKLCQQEVEAGISEANPPFGCVITDQSGKVLVAAHNTQNTDNDPTAHAEINALRKLGKERGSRYLTDCIVFANAESCSMCASACIKAHIYAFYYGAPAEAGMDPWLPMAEVAQKAKNPTYIEGSILAIECADQIVRGRSVSK